MRDLEQRIARHYTREALERTILDGLAATGRKLDEVTPDDLGAIDEFHMGGRPATVEIAGRLRLGADSRLLDLGCGIGGAARHFAQAFGCRVTGIDLTSDYVAVARALTRLVGLDDRVAFHQGSVMDLPFDAAEFSAATLLHVGMNLPDKTRLFAEVARVLEPGGVFVVYDVMRLREAEPAFPTAWAASPATSFLATPATYRDALTSAGFTILDECDRTELALSMFARLRARMAAAGPPPVGLHILMGADAATKIANMVRALDEGVIAPIEMLCEKRVSVAAQPERAQ